MSHAIIMFNKYVLSVRTYIVIYSLMFVFCFSFAGLFVVMFEYWTFLLVCFNLLNKEFFILTS